MPEENDEQDHLMGGQGTQEVQAHALRDALVAGNGPRAGRVQACALAFVVSIWAMVLYATGGKVPFALYHPLLVSLGLYLLLQGILVLQSTQTPQEKDAGLALHQLFVLGAGLPLLTFGVWIMWHSHSKPGAKHFISWHGVLGVALLALLWAQALLGASTVWAQEPVFGSVGKAKSVWKYHRYVPRLTQGPRLRYRRPPHSRDHARSVGDQVGTRRRIRAHDRARDGRGVCACIQRRTARQAVQARHHATQRTVGCQVP